MDISVPSRFSCLKIEDDEFRPVTNKNNKKKSENKTIKKCNSSNNTTATNCNNKKPAVVKQTLSGPSSKKNKKGKQDVKQWEEWKRKDDELVNDNFEQDLQSAILQSKIDYEKQKKNAVASQSNSQSSNKKKKNKTMSLDQFLEKAPVTNGEAERGCEEDSEYFEKLVESAKHEVKRERVEEKRRQREANIEEIITVAQYQEKLEKEKAKNKALENELEEARQEISIVKKRNTTLCSMLSQGEMKDKAAVLLELQRLTIVKDELTEEVNRLHKLLEQERSKASVPVESHSSKHKEKKIKKK